MLSLKLNKVSLKLNKVASQTLQNCPSNSTRVSLKLNKTAPNSTRLSPKTQQDSLKFNKIVPQSQQDCPSTSIRLSLKFQKQERGGGGGGRRFTSYHVSVDSSPPPPLFFFLQSIRWPRRINCKSFFTCLSVFFLVIREQKQALLLLFGGCRQLYCWTVQSRWQSLCLQSSSFHCLPLPNSIPPSLPPTPTSTDCLLTFPGIGVLRNRSHRVSVCFSCCAFLTDTLVPPISLKNQRNHLWVGESWEWWVRHGGVGGGEVGRGQSSNTPHCLFVHRFCFSACEVHSWCLTSPSMVTPAGQHRRLWDLPVTPASRQGAPAHLLASHHVDLLTTPASHNRDLEDLLVTPAGHDLWLQQVTMGALRTDLWLQQVMTYDSSKSQWGTWGLTCDSSRSWLMTPASHNGELEDLLVAPASHIGGSEDLTDTPASHNGWLTWGSSKSWWGAWGHDRELPVTQASHNGEHEDLLVTPASHDGHLFVTPASHGGHLFVTPASQDGGLEDLPVTPTSHDGGLTCDSSKPQWGTWGLILWLKQVTLEDLRT